MKAFFNVRGVLLSLFLGWMVLLPITSFAATDSLNSELDSVSTTIEEVVKGNFAKIIVLLAVVFMAIGLSIGWNTKLVLGATGTAIVVGLFPGLLMNIVSVFGS